MFGCLDFFFKMGTSSAYCDYARSAQLHAGTAGDLWPSKTVPERRQGAPFCTLDTPEQPEGSLSGSPPQALPSLLQRPVPRPQAAACVAKTPLGSLSHPSTP
eukprot:EG_transcript_58759